jgi:DNA-binding LytR/AlgR family response regulator
MTDKTVRRCLDEYFEEFADDSYFEFVAKKSQRKIAVSSILYFESSNRKIIIQTLHGSIELSGRLSDIQKESIFNGFISIHKSFLVNSRQISENHFE